MGNVAEMQHAIYIYKEYGAPSQVVLFYLDPVYIIFFPPIPISVQCSIFNASK